MPISKYSYFHRLLRGGKKSLQAILCSQCFLACLTLFVPTAKIRPKLKDQLLQVLNVFSLPVIIRSYKIWCSTRILLLLSVEMKKIILITGGQRSGKSQYAEQLALSLSERPVYVATAHVWDDEFRERVRRHQERRGPEWENVEEERWLSRLDLTGRVALVDCLTLWATNFFFDLQDVDKALDALKTEFDKLCEQEATLILVTNEIGWGGTSESKVQRQFTDLLGWLNQYVASRADEVVMMVSGIPVKIKGEG